MTSAILLIISTTAAIIVVSSFPWASVSPSGMGSFESHSDVRMELVEVKQRGAYHCHLIMITVYTLWASVSSSVS